MLGGPVIQQHVVEFIRGSGVKTDGVLDGTSINGPWTWVVPMGVAQIFATGCGAGSGGSGGTNNATSSGGGGGGGTGMCVFDFPIDVVQNTSLQVTVGAKGVGGTPTVAATAGGDTIIDGVVTPIMTDTGAIIRFIGGEAGTTSTGGAGLSGLRGGKLSAVGAGGASAATAGNGVAIVTELGNGSTNQTPTILVFAQGGAGGGGGSTTVTNVGGNGGTYPSSAFVAGMWTNFSETASTLPTGGIGNSTGVGGISRGGGGIGGTSLFGEGGSGGNGGANGTNATGYGAGGGGGGGAANGGDGSDGYLRISYWSAH